jgi:hypothetical protein
MQNVGIQTVLQMSNAAERVQSGEQSHAPLAAEHSKEEVEKKRAEMMDTINQTEQTENAKIREEDQKKRQEQKKKEEEQKREQEMHAMGNKEVPLPVSASDTHGKLLNITV